MNINKLRNRIECKKTRSAWDNGVKKYALELLEDWEWEHEGEEFYGNPANEKELLNGASNWQEYSEGGCSLIYNQDICFRLCTPSERKITRNGERNPNGRETWIDCQARALFQAQLLIFETVEK